MRTCLSAAQWALQRGAKNRDHPSLAMPAVRRLLAAAARHDDPRRMLRARVWTTEPAHALHHYAWRNFPHMYLDWNALLGRPAQTTAFCHYPSLFSFIWRIPIRTTNCSDE